MDDDPINPEDSFGVKVAKTFITNIAATAGLVVGLVAGITAVDYLKAKAGKKPTETTEETE